jgi:hypothetical protein
LKDQSEVRKDQSLVNPIHGHVQSPLNAESNTESASIPDGFARATLIYLDYDGKTPVWVSLGYAKRAKKYVYFIEEDSGRPRWGDPHKYELGQVIVYWGWRQEIKDRVERFVEELSTWRLRFDDARREITAEEYSEMNERIGRRLEEWIKQNPEPKWEW